MKRLLTLTSTVLFILFFVIYLKGTASKEEVPAIESENAFQTITGIIQPRETMELIFKKHDLKMADLSDIVRVSKDKHNLSNLSVGNTYMLQIDNSNNLQNIEYAVDGTSFLDITRHAEGFVARKREYSYDQRIGSLSLTIRDNLISSMPDTHREYLRIALELSDIYAWDIDFSSDIKNGDSVKLILQELWIGNAFKGYGNILAAEFINNGNTIKAYRFEDGENSGYYDAEGKSLQKTLLRSPLKFRHISSHFSKRRLHPILRIYRPHLGVDYAAPAGTPVSAAGDGKVLFAGYKGQNGNMVRIKHRGGFETYYGHLSRIPKKIKRGRRVSQGEGIGYVGTTGLSTGPHLDYRIKLNGSFVNPLKVKLPRGESVPKRSIADFIQFIDIIDKRLLLLADPVIATSGSQESSVNGNI